MAPDLHEYIDALSVSVACLLNSGVRAKATYDQSRADYVIVRRQAADEPRITVEIGQHIIMPVAYREWLALGCFVSPYRELYWYWQHATPEHNADQSALAGDQRLLAVGTLQKNATEVIPGVKCSGLSNRPRILEPTLRHGHPVDTCLTEVVYGPMMDYARTYNRIMIRKQVSPETEQRCISSP